MRYITIRTSFIGYHRYKNAPQKVKYLRDWHRHNFNIEAYIEVVDANREIEFIIKKAEIDGWLAGKYHGAKFEKSCEMIAEDIAKKFNCFQVTVSEDGENGGGYYKLI